MSIREDRKRQRRRKKMKKTMMLFMVFIVAVILGLAIHAYDVKHKDKDTETKAAKVENQKKDTETEIKETETEEPEFIRVGDVEFKNELVAEKTANTITPDKSDVKSKYSILVNEYTNEIVAEKNSTARINPASMTKVLTLLVAAENVPAEKLDDKFEITLEMTDFAYVNDCSTVGFLDGEEVAVKDLFYGTILPSGGDAAIGLATYVAGSHEAFVEKMNEKLEELGLSDTAHFTNCVGLYDEDHYCTVYDMAIILKAAVENDFCREVLQAHTYTTVPTKQHPDGITISNWFLRRIEDKDSGGLVMCAKTGYVVQSRNCAASYEISESGVPYICVTAKAKGGWRCIYDHVAMYKKYAK